VNVVLRSDVDGLGEAGQVVEVADGYARNFLMPRGLAMVATDGTVRQAETMRRARDLRVARDRGAAEEIARVLVPQVVTIEANVGAEGHLYGSITTSDVADAVLAQTGIDLDRRKLHVDEPIREVGVHEVNARLHRDVQFVIRVEITAR
jgi:large subunit ribosomal protein L9